jgi:hypothetical protein
MFNYNWLAADETEKKITEPGDLNNPPGTGADEVDFEEDDEDEDDDDDDDEDEDEEEEV